MKFRFKTYESVPPGQYTVRFTGCEETSHEEFGPGVIWKFEVAEAGPYEGWIVTRITQVVPTQKNACGKMIKGLAGARLDETTDIDTARFVGQLYSAFVQENASGKGTRVESVMPAGRQYQQPRGQQPQPTAVVSDNLEEPDYDQGPEQIPF